MKHLKRLLMTVLAAMLLLTACNDEGETTTDEATGDTTATTTSAPAPAVTTPSTIVIIRHKVKDYEKWKPAYDGHDSARLANGLHSFVLGRGVEDPSMVMVALRADDVEKAKAFSKNPDLKTVMEKAGVVGAPDVFIGTISSLKPNVSSDLRVMSTFDVKDWNAWKSGFEAGQSIRIENGLEDRGYGHAVDDNHKIMYVAAVTDSAKAVAYYKSALLKARLDSAGVVGTPKRLWYRVVQTY